MSMLYLGALLVSVAGMAALDLRGRLFLWRDPGRAGIVLAAGVAFFLAWDAAGIGLGVFFRGAPELLCGILLAPELPLEEIVFLVLLCWLTMNLYGWLSRPRADARDAPEAPG